MSPVAAGTTFSSSHPNPSSLKAAFSKPFVALSSSDLKAPLLAKFLNSYHELESYKDGKPITIDGQTLSVAAITAAARHNSPVILDNSPIVRDRVAKSRKVIADKVDSGTSVYGLSTGFGGSADTRTDKPLLLGQALLQHQHIGVLPSPSPIDVLPLQDPSSSAMPESWVRGAMLIRMNSLIRGHSGVRWELIEKINELLSANITPMVPLRGSISASGDLSPLSYLAGTLIANPAIRVFHGRPIAPNGARQSLPSARAFEHYGIKPLPLASKEHLGILNGTAFSTSVACLALNDAVHLALLSQVCTALGTEALLGTRGSYDPFIHDVTRPHPGQIECARNIYRLLDGSKFARLHEEEVSLKNDQYSLRQDRYPLRTSPQFIGPQLEDILAALAAVTQESNSTTDNPLVDGETGEIHHGGNFQAMAITNAMEKTRLALHHIGKILFAQATELGNPAMNNGLPPNLAATDPSLNYHGKGLDIATAAYVAELGYLASPVSTHIQSAEMHNQAVNSLALISGRATLNSLDVLSILIASYLYLLCQALDIRALQYEFTTGLEAIVEEELSRAFASLMTTQQQSTLKEQLIRVMSATLDKTSTMDNIDRMEAVTASTTTVFVDFFSAPEFRGVSGMESILAFLGDFRSRVASRSSSLLEDLRREYLSGDRGTAPAAPYLSKTKAIYEFIRNTLAIPMHGKENHGGFSEGLGIQDDSIGQNVTRIYEAIRDGKIQSTVVSLFA